MFNLVKANFTYTFQNKFYTLIQILMLVYIAVVAGLYSYKYSLSTDYMTLHNIPLPIFLFVTTFLLLSTTMMSPKEHSNNCYGVFILSFPIKKSDLVTSYYIEILIYKLITLFIIYIVSFVTLMVTGRPISGTYFLLIFFIVLYVVGVMGSLYILVYFTTKFYKPIMYVLYFVSFFSATSILDTNIIFHSEYFNVILYMGILFIPLSYIVSLIMAKKKDF